MTARVLVVDDDPVQRRPVEAMLRRFGHEPLTAEGGEAAIRRLADARAEPVGCVLLELAMGGLDGIAVLARLRALDIAVPVIALTGQGNVEAAVGAMRAGACDVMVKPVVMERLQVALASAFMLASAFTLGSAFAPADASAAGAPGVVPADPPSLALLDAHGHMRPLGVLEDEAIRFAIAYYDGRINEVARRLEIGRSTLYRKLAELGLDGSEREAGVQDGVAPDRTRSVAPE
jgi:DNA-binding NtrC family response regulator